MANHPLRVHVGRHHNLPRPDAQARARRGHAARARQDLRQLARSRTILRTQPSRAHHGQPASPTTLGRRWRTSRAAETRSRADRRGHAPRKANVRSALQRPRRGLSDVDWEKFARDFVTRLGLEFNPYTIQTSPTIRCRAARRYARANTILVDLATASLGLHLSRLFQAEAQGGEIGLPPCRTRSNR